MKVCLSGGGGDELFGGYPWRYYRAVVNNDFDDYVEKYFGFWQRMLPRDMVKQVLAPVWGDASQVAPLIFFATFLRRIRTIFADPKTTSITPVF